MLLMTDFLLTVLTPVLSLLWKEMLKGKVRGGRFDSRREGTSDVVQLKVESLNTRITKKDSAIITVVSM